MKIINEFLNMPFFLGIIFLLLGLLLYFFPPKKINIIYGYKTSNSMKSQERWDFAQKFSAVKMIQSGLATLILSLLLFFFHFKENNFVVYAVLIIIVFYIIFFTEKAIKSKFDSK